MKRCIICGNVDDDNSTVCSMCGNPYVDMSGRTVGEYENNAEKPGEETATEETGPVQEPEAEEAEPAQEPEAEEAQPAQGPEAEEAQPAQEPEAEEAEPAQEPEAEEAQPVQEPEAEEPQPAQAARGDRQGARIPGQAPTGRPPRRTRSGPQIYGQEEGMNGNPELYANQGMIRRDVPPRSAGAGRPAGQMPGGAGRPAGQVPGGAGRLAGPVPGGAGRPAGQMPGGASRPTGQVPGNAGRPAAQDSLARRVMETARKAMRSPLFFLIVLLNTACVASSIAAIFMNELNYSQVVRLLNESNLPQQASGYVSTATALLQKLDSGMIVANLMLHIPSILFCLGLWLIFITAIAAKERMSGVGFGFAKAAVIIRMIAACLVMLAVLIVSVAIVVAAWMSGQTSVIVMAVVMLVIMIIIVLMVIMYYFSYLGTLKACRVNGNKGESYGKLSAYLAVMLTILSLPGIVGLLSGIVNMEISNIVGSIAEMGWMILLAVWIFLYRGKMSGLGE